jgi:putative NADH-flavin reductase
MNKEYSSQIALVGATGKLGSVLAERFLERGYAVRALVRDPTRLTPRDRAGFTVLRGDATDPGALAELLSGCPYAVNATSNARNPAPISLKLTQDIAGLLEEGARYFVVSGMTVKSGGDEFSMDALCKRIFMKAMFPAIVADKQAEYRFLETVRMSWTMVRCPMIVDGGDDSYASSLSACGGKSVSKGGVASFILDEIARRGFQGRSPFVFSPRVFAR